MAGAVYVIKDKGWAAMERGGCGSGERRRNATVTMITAARLTRAPLGPGVPHASRGFARHYPSLRLTEPHTVTSNQYGRRRRNSVRPSYIR